MAETAEAAAQLQKKKMSNFLVPPPSGLRTHNVLSILSSLTAISSIVSPHPSATKRVPNNQQGALDASFNFDEAERRKNTPLLLELLQEEATCFGWGKCGDVVIFYHGAERSYHGYAFLITGGVSEVGGGSRGAS